MMTALRHSGPVTIEAFDKFVEGQADGVLFELLAGKVVVMDDPTEAHEQVRGNIGASLKLAMDARRCLVFWGGIRVQRSDDRSETNTARPGVVVRRGALTAKSYVTDPLVVIEVLSPSTMDTDRGPKLDFYKSLPTVRHIALVYQDQMRVEHYRREERGFELDALKHPEDLLHFEAVAFHIDLASIYFGVTV